jgi:hypothetical protein
MGASKRAAQRRHQRKQESKAKRRRVSRPPLNSLIAPRSESEIICQRGTSRHVGRGIENTQQYAVLLAQHGRCDDALRLCDEGLRRYPMHRGLLITREDVLMLSGDLSPQVWRGWLRNRKWPFRQPRWQGEPLPGKTILLWEDYTPGPMAYGLGDATQMVRLAPVVKAQSQATVMLAVPRGMKRLYSRLVGVDAILEPPLPTEGFDVQCPLPVIPMLPGYELTAERLSAAVPYLFAEEDAVGRWAPTFDSAQVNVGIHWRADPNHQDPKQHRSLPLADLAPLFSLEGVRFYSLQYNGGDEPKDYPAVVDLGNIDDPAERFMQTAAVMTHLDLVICTDSGPSHVAGALGTKVWMLLSWASQDARWGLQQQTPWYPGHTLLRCWGDWHELVWQVRDVLKSDIAHGVYRRSEPTGVTG